MAVLYNKSGPHQRGLAWLGSITTANVRWGQVGQKRHASRPCSTHAGGLHPTLLVGVAGASGRCHAGMPDKA